MLQSPAFAGPLFPNSGNIRRLGDLQGGPRQASRSPRLTRERSRKRTRGRRNRALSYTRSPQRVGAKGQSDCAADYFLFGKGRLAKMSDTRIAPRGKKKIVGR